MQSAVIRKVRLDDFVELTKPRIVLFVMITVAVGFWMPGPPLDQPLLLFHLLFGTALVAAGTNALNQVAERDVDSLMQRTRGRPLPTGRLSVTSAGVFAWSTGVAGVAYLAVLVNGLAALLAAATLVTYVFFYTPLKRRTSVSTLVGAVPGALPILGGWAAATGSVNEQALVLFWILFLWQLPHFLALGWLYREDYARAGLRMLSVTNPDGKTTFWYATLYAAALLPMSIVPTLVGITGGAYFAGALVLSLLFFAASFAAVRSTTAVNAKRVFRYSLVYLPALLLLMGWDRIV